MAGPDEWVDDEWTDDEWVDDSAVPAPVAAAPAAPVQAAPEPSFMEQWGEQVMQSVGPKAGPLDAPLAVFGPPLKAAKQAFIDPIVTAGQDALRSHPEVQKTLQSAEAFGNMVSPDVGKGVKTLTEDVLQLGIGPAEKRSTPAEMDARYKSVADLPPNLGMGDRPVLSAGLQSLAGEASYLPLYLIDAPAAAGPVAKALVGGGLSETLDPRESSDPLRGAVMAGGLGAGLQAAATGLSKLRPIAESPTLIAAKKATDAVRWLKNLDGEVARSVQKAISVTPAEGLKALADAPAVAPLKGGAKASFLEARVGETGTVETRKVAITADGQKLANEWLPVGERGMPVRGVVLATPEAAEAMGKLDGDFGEVLVARDMSADDLALSARPGYGLDEVTIREGGRERVALQDDAALPLHELPSGDALVAWKREGGTLDFKPVRARTLQRESLIRRSPVEVTVGGEKRIGFLGAGDASYDIDGKYLGPNGNTIIIAPDPAEKIPGALESDISIPDDRFAHVPTDRLSKLLDERDAVLAQEAADALNAADSQAATELAASGVTVVQTPVGLKVATSSMDAPPLDPMPAAAPPGSPPDGPGGGFSGVPPPPMPPNPGMLDRNIPDRVGWLQNALSPTFLPPTVTGPLDATAAATMIASSRNTDALRSRVDEASRRVMRPVLNNLTPQQVRTIDAATVEFIEGRKSLEDLLKEHPILAGEAEQHWEATRARSQQVQAVLEARGNVHPLEFTVPGGGKESLDFVRNVKSSRAYLMQPYYAHTLESGAWAKYVKRNEAEYGALVKRYVDEVVAPGQRAANNPLDRKSMEAIAERELDAVLRDPDALAEKFNVEIRRGTKRNESTNALKPKAAQGLEEALVIMGKRAESWTPVQKDAAYRFVAGSADEKELGRAFSDGPAGTEKDLQFLRETRERADTALPGWLKMALGPVESPVTRASFTAEAQEELLMRSEALETLVKAGAVLPQDVLAISRPSALNGGETERWIRIPDNKRLYGNHAGKYVHPAYGGFLYYDEARDGMQNLVTRFLTSVSRKWKVAQTVLSQGSWLVNVMGNLNGMAMSGTMPLSDILNPKRAPASFVDSIAQWRDFTHAPNKLSTPEQRSGADWIRDSIKYGVMSSDFVSAEFKQVLDKWARMSFPGERAPATTVDYLLAMADAAKGAGTKALKTYGAIDPFFKHVNWLNGVRRGGVDIKTGKLADREAAVRFLRGWGGDETILRSMNDADLAERVKAGNARVIAESHPQPDRMGRTQESIAKIGDATGVLGTVNQFYRTSSEVLRTHMMLPYRMMARPGVASSVTQYAMLAAAMGVGMTALKRRLGIDPEEERKSFMALPPAMRKFKPGAFALPVPKDDAGRLTYLDMGRMFDAIKFFNGEVGGRPLLEGLSETPGQVMSNVAYNMASTGLGFGNTTDAVARDFLEDSGILPPVVDRQAVQPGAAAALDRIWRMAAPGFARTALKAVNQSTPSQLNPNPVSPLRSAAEMMTGGIVFQGGSDRDAAKQGRSLMKQQEKVMRPSLMREGTPLGPTQRFDRKKDIESRREQVQQIRNIRR